MLNVGTRERNLNRKFFRFTSSLSHARTCAVFEALQQHARPNTLSFSELVCYAKGCAREQQRQAQLEIELSSARQVI